MSTTIKTYCSICKSVRYTLDKPKYPMCRNCRKDPEHSQTKRHNCRNCNKTLSYKTKDDICRVCRPKRSKKYMTDYNLTSKRRENNIPYYEDSEIIEFLNELDLDFNNMCKEQFLINMLKIINYSESRLRGTELLQGTVKEQLRFMVKGLFKEVNMKNKKII